MRHFKSGQRSTVHQFGSRPHERRVERKRAGHESDWRHFYGVQLYADHQEHSSRASRVFQLSELNEFEL